MTEAFFFDAGHTLLRTRMAIAEVYARAARAMGARVDPAAIEPAFGEVFASCAAAFADEGTGRASSDEHDARMWRWVTAEVHRRVPELKAVDAHGWWVRLHEAFGRADHWELYPDVVPALRELRRRGVRIGVISNWSTRLRPIAGELGLLEMVDFLLVSAEFGAGKPHRRIFDEALRLAEVGPERALHAGDSVEDDVRGAAAAGIRPVFVWRRAGEPHPADGARVVRDLRELL